MISNLYIIGGSPCSGKSTIAERLSSEYNMLYYKADDYYNKHIDQALKDKITEMTKFTKMDSDQIWLNRSIQKQFIDAIEFYRQEFKMCISDIEKMKTKKPIIAEGAVFMPFFVDDYSIPYNRYFCLVPSFDFQMEHYKKRGWVENVLKDSSNKEKAFENWMLRDYEFSKYAKATANKLKYASYEINSNTDANSLYENIINLFGLETK